MPDINDLSGKQRKVYLYVKNYILEKGFPPTVREIGQAVGASSTSTVHAHLNHLEREGFIRRDPDKPRALEILDKNNQVRSNVLALPVIGTVTAGTPILAEENIEEYLPLPLSFVREEDSFILRVRGDSMIEAGIFDKDYVIVRKQDYADDGDIVVALLDDSATVKRFFMDDRNVIRLQPENSSMEPIIVSQVTILGKVTGLFRRVR